MRRRVEVRVRQSEKVVDNFIVLGTRWLEGNGDMSCLWGLGMPRV